jgi:hypothetical protein
MRQGFDLLLKGAHELDRLLHAAADFQQREDRPEPAAEPGAFRDGQERADELTHEARSRGEQAREPQDPLADRADPFLRTTGGRTSSGWSRQNARNAAGSERLLSSSASM